MTHRHLDYAGQVIVASRWQLDWGMPLAKDDQHFRLVIMTAEAAESVKPETLQDPRIAVVYPAALSDEAQRAAADYLAWQAMSDDYAAEQAAGQRGGGSPHLAGAPALDLPGKSAAHPTPPVPKRQGGDTRLVGDQRPRRLRRGRQ